MNNGDVALIKVPNTKTNVSKSFVLTDAMFEIFKKYCSLRPKNTKCKNLLIRYYKGECTIQAVGIQTIGKLPRDVVVFLKLENPESYTGHCFRRTGTTLLANSGVDNATETLWYLEV